MRSAQSRGLEPAVNARLDAKRYRYRSLAAHGCGEAGDTGIREREL
jgi:hypothetical protein